MAADRDELKQQSKNALVSEVLRLRRLLEQQLQAGPALSDTLFVHGVVLAGTDEPAVQWRCGEAAGQFSSLPAAVAHGAAVITAAVEAERDAATIAFLREAGFDDDHVGPFLHAMRRHRTAFVDGLSTAREDGAR